MSKKIFFTLLLISLFMLNVCFSFAATNVGNDLMTAGNSVGNAVKGTANTAADGARNLVNGAATLGNGAVNTANNLGNDAANTMGTTANVLDNTDGDYTATRTATGNNNLLGMSDTTWTWLILGIVGAVIVALVWYYGAQYEHRNYNND